MPNRYWREGQLRSRKLAVASAEAYRLFGKLVSAVDDFGRMDADPAIVRSACYPRELHLYSEDQVAAWLEELDCCTHLILRYRSGRDTYLVLMNAEPPRNKTSKYPPPPASIDGQIRSRSVDGPPESCPHRSGDFPRGFAQASEPSSVAGRHNLRRAVTTCDDSRAINDPDPDPDHDPGNDLGKAKQEKTPAPDGASALDLEFLEFSRRYPRPKNDPAKPAREKYRAARRRGVGAEVILSGLQAEVAERDALTRNGEFVRQMPMMKTWLHQQQWVDALQRYSERQFRPPHPSTADEYRRQWLLRMLELRSDARRRGKADLFDRAYLRTWSDDERRRLHAELDRFEPAVPDGDSPSLPVPGQEAAGGSA